MQAQNSSQGGQIYAVYQSHMNKNRESNNGQNEYNHEGSQNNFTDTNMMQSNFPGETTIATSRPQTAVRRTYQENNNFKSMDNYPRTIKEEKSNMQVVHNISQEEYDHINNAMHQKQNQTRNKNHFQKSSEFTFVGCKTAESPHNHLNMPQQTEFVSSSRQSIVLNPLTDVNLTSTKKKQNQQRNIAYGQNPRRMTNIQEEENYEYQSELEESAQVQQCHDTDGFTQNMRPIDMHQVNEQQQEDEIQNQYNPENIKMLIDEYNEMQNVCEVLAQENDAMREMVDCARQSFTFIAHNCSDPKTVRDESFDILNRIQVFMNENNAVSQQQTQSNINEEACRSTYQYESQQDGDISYVNPNNINRQNGNYTQTSLLSPIPQAVQSTEYRHFDTFSQRENDASARVEHLKSQTEYSYQDPDNFVIHQPKEEQNRGKSKNSRNSS